MTKSVDLQFHDNKPAADQSLNAGLPPLHPGSACKSWFEFSHPALFYAPLFVYLLCLMVRYRSITLPTLANPNIFAGGMIGERKSQVLDTAGAFARTFIAPYARLTKTRTTHRSVQAALDAMALASLRFPIVAKPDTGLRGAGVRPVKSNQDLSAYIEAFPNGHDIVLQHKIEYQAEAGVFYVRRPDDANGYIFSLTLKYRSMVRGDGRTSLRGLIMACPRAAKMRKLFFARHAKRLDDIIPEGEVFALNFAGNHARGAIFRDGATYITPEMTEIFDRISKDLPGFHFGRFDIRFESMETLQAGRNFQIVEINGAGAEATHIWDCNMSLSDAYRTLGAQWRLAFEIGAANAQRNHSRPSAGQLFKVWWSELRRANIYPLTY